MEVNKLDTINIKNLVNNAAGAAEHSAEDDFAKRLEAAAEKNDDKELKKACQEFEAIMLDMLYKQMKATVIKSDLIEADPGKEIFESMLDEQLMEQAAKTGSIGLAESLYKQLSRQYGRQLPNTAGAAGGNTQKRETPSEETD